MRSLEFILEKTNARGLSSLKAKVKARIDATDDETLLHRIYTSLNSGTLMKRLETGLQNLSDPEIHSFLSEIANAIVQAPGSYEEKLSFISGLHEGFIDVDLMIDGQRHHFADLLKPTKQVPRRFLFDMFNALKDLGGKAKKGPGEFAIAIMSPQVSVFGGGDLKIGKKIVEVKAEKGTIGATGYFQHSKVPIILQQYFPNIDLSRNVGAEGLAQALKSTQLDPKTLKEFSDKLVDYIFKAQEAWADTTALKKAIQNPQSPTLARDITQGYLRASYSAYKGREGGKSKFDGVMLMDFSKQELRYFDDPDEMFGDIDAVQFSIFSKNKEWGSKAINPGVKLRTEPLPTPDVPTKQSPAALKGYYGQTAEWILKKAQQANPRNIELREPELKDEVTQYILQIVKQGTPHKKIVDAVRQRFPELKLRAPKVVTPPPAPVKKARVTPSNPPAFKNSGIQ
jgi:hypothetical protein